MAAVRLGAPGSRESWFDLDECRTESVASEALRLACDHVLTSEGWRRDVTIAVDDAGMISALDDTKSDDPRVSGFVVPGVPNLHSHAFQRALAGLTENVEPGQSDSFWTWRTRMYELALRLEPDDLESIAAQLYVEMLECGMTAVGEFHYLHHAPDGKRYDRPEEMSLRIFAAADTAGIALTHLPVLYLAGGFGRAPEDHQRRFVHRDVDEFFDTIEPLKAAILGHPNDRIGIAPHSLRAVPAADLANAVAHSRGPVHIHIAEQMAEVEACQTTLGTTPVRWLMDNVAVDQRFCLVHATHVDDEELDKMVAAGATAGLCPTTEANLGDGLFPARSFLDRGGVFGVGSDSHVTVSVSEELRLLEYGQRLVAQRRNLLVHGDRHVGTALYARAALGGAAALEQPSGAIAVGRRADLVRLDDTHPRLVGHGPETSLDAWIFGSTDDVVTDVWVGGTHVVRAGQHVRRDAVRRRFRETMTKLHATS